MGSDILLADPDDDYQPLDPAYLPPGLEDEGKCGKVMCYNKIWSLPSCNKFGK